jgi:hypothetical protein
MPPMSIRPLAPSRRLSAAGKRTGAWLLMAALAGCAAPPPLARVAPGQQVELVVLVSTADGGVTKIHNLALGEGVRGGAAAGLVAGSLWGLGCGPLALLCMPLGALIVAVPGAALGTAAGAGYALPDEKAAALRVRLVQVQQAVDLTQALRSSVTQRAQQHWTLVAEPAAWVLTLELQPLELSSSRDEQIGLMVRVTASLLRADSRAAATRKTFEYKAPLSSLSVWLDERSDFVETIFAASAQQLATQIVAEVASR